MRVWQFLKAMGRVLRAWFRRDPVLVSSDEAEQRLAVCEAPCELFDARQRLCMDCGCFVDAKAPLATEKCRKWPV